ncbi:MAG TPA: heavy-metal-associated domain-containing protein [Streptosporangiaceae bacterium]|nr:heavy-metal-associated domain-containing protein [Streptosporangiaceae bacterium]
MQESVYSVSGMTCSHCASAVRSEITRIPGVREVTVDLDAGLVTVEADGQPDRAAVRAAVEEAGYQLVG